MCVAELKALAQGLALRAWPRPFRRQCVQAQVRILVVEDERRVAQALEEGLEAESYAVEVAHTGEEGFFRVNSEPFDLMVLDVMLPGRTGLEVRTPHHQRRFVIN
jgi:CheY-like chemotaxis protein